MQLLATCRATFCRSPRSSTRPNSPIPQPPTSRAFNRLPCRPASSISPSFHHPRTPNLPEVREEPNVDTNSLSETLQAHREANRTSLINRVYGKGIEKVPISVPSRIQERRHERGVLKERRPAVHRPLITGVQNKRSNHDIPEYIGEAREVSQKWTLSPELTSTELYPWLVRVPQEEVLVLDRLNAEIRAFDEYISPSSLEKKAAQRALADLFTTIQYATPSTEIDIIGSRSTGLSTPFSDIDLNLTPTTESSSSDPIKLLRYLSKQLQRKRVQNYTLRSGRKPVKFNSFLSKAKVPIVSGVHEPTGLEFQIQSKTDSFESMQFTKSWIAEYPTMRSLYLVLKQILKMRGLHDGPSGGLTTYPLIGMIVAALKLSEGRHHRHAVGQQLLFFLDMYSDIDFYKTGISILPPKYSEKVSLAEHVSKRLAPEPEWLPVSRPGRPFLMSLQDPANFTNDLGVGVILIKHIQETFKMARRKLKEAMEEWEGERDGKSTDRNSKQPLLAWSLGGDYSIFELEREELRRASSNSRFSNWQKISGVVSANVTQSPLQS